LNIRGIFMFDAKGYAAQSETSPLAPYEFQRRDVGGHDVLIKIRYCGVCHSDIHQVRNEWGGAIYPMVPGHEIVGEVVSVGHLVSKFKTGDIVGVGCFVDSCRTCSSCKSGVEQYCEGQIVFTYNSLEKDGKTLTFGGYSSNIVVDENFVLSVPSNINAAGAAPLLCAGITTYSPLKYWGVDANSRVGVLGLGGLGHMAVKFAASFGAEVVVLSSSLSKEADAMKLGANRFVHINNESEMESLHNSLDLIVDTVSVPHDLNSYLELLRCDGTLVLVGIPTEGAEVKAISLIRKRRNLTGSLIGGIKETQELLKFCGENNILSEVEVIPIDYINTAYDRMIKSDVRYRFVIDLETL
jgi:alcohol dehydrogenase (NADP+)